MGEEEMEQQIIDLIHKINDKLKEMKSNKQLHYQNTGNLAIVSEDILDEEFKGTSLYGTVYTTKSERIFCNNGYGYTVLEFLKNKYNQLSK